MKVPESIKKGFDEWCLIFSCYFVIFAACWLAFAIWGNGSTSLRGFVIYAVCYSLIVSVAVCWIGNAVPVFLKLLAKKLADIPDRMFRYWIGMLKRYSLIFIFGCVIAWMLIFIFDFQLNSRFESSRYLKFIIGNPVYTMLLGGLTAIYFDMALNTFNQLNHCRSRYWGR